MALQLDGQRYYEGGAPTCSLVLLNWIPAGGAPISGIVADSVKVCRKMTPSEFVPMNRVSVESIGSAVAA